MRKTIIVLVALVLSIPAIAQLEVKEDSFKEVPGFVNINTDKMYDDNNKPYAVIKIRTENINNKQRRELVFEGNAATFFELEYKVGEIWVYISYYATFIKISHPDLSSTEFWFPFDMEPKKGYELTLINKPPVDEEILSRIERLEGVYNTNNANAQIEKDTTPEKQLNGVFSVSKDKKVIFSQGNLQYKATINTWRFAENQWDYIGDNNANISREYDGWIDLYGWGTSGYGNAHPYSTSENEINYAPNGSDITDSYYDWGIYNTISNGKEYSWYTLSSDEWKYLLIKRKTLSNVRFAKALVNDTEGIIILPDNWDNQTYNLNNVNQKSSNYRNNTISKFDWMNYLETNGAVFLPAAGYRYGTRMNKDGNTGRYWTTTYTYRDFSNKFNTYYYGYGCCFEFDANSLHTGENRDKWDGCSVRLVRDVK